jgi:hypothetical protein
MILVSGSPRSKKCWTMMITSTTIYHSVTSHHTMCTIRRSTDRWSCTSIQVQVEEEFGLNFQRVLWMAAENVSLLLPSWDSGREVNHTKFLGK